MCRHESLDYLGEQKTDDEVNVYYKCRVCGDMLVVTPERNVIAVEGIQNSEPSRHVGTTA